MPAATAAGRSPSAYESKMFAFRLSKTIVPSPSTTLMSPVAIGELNSRDRSVSELVTTSARVSPIGVTNATAGPASVWYGSDTRTTPCSRSVRFPAHGASPAVTVLPISSSSVLATTVPLSCPR